MKHSSYSGLIFASLLLVACGKAETGETSAPVTPTKTEVVAEQPATSVAQDLPENDTAYKLVIVGDSIMAGYGLSNQLLLTDGIEAALKDQGRDIVIVNAGVSGDRMQEGAARFNWSVGPGADGVLIALGGNDLLRGVEPAVTREHLETMLASAKERDLWVSIAGIPAPGNATPDFAAEFNALFTELSADYCAALYPNFLEGVIGNPALNQGDGIHPNPEGVAAIVSGLSPWLGESLDGEHNPCG